MMRNQRNSDFRDRSRDRDRERSNRDRGRDGDRDRDNLDRQRDADRQRDNRDRERDGDRQRDTRDRERDGDRYRDHGRRRDYRDRSPDRGGERYERRQRSRSPRRHTSGFRFKGDEPKRRPRENTEKKEPREPKEAKAPNKAPKPSATAGQEMIIVHVNDRLGTKSAIPCLPSDTVGQFKLMIAARIGREAGQIMLRRQGERPFKDHITLEDYGISNGVQLDLEVDTGD